MVGKKEPVSLGRRLYSTRNAADYLGLHYSTIRKMVMRGELTVIKSDYPWSRWLFDKRDLDEWIERHRMSA